MTASKTCRDCKIEKGREEFTPSHILKDGMHTYCKACMNLRAKKWQAANRDKHLQHKRNSRNRKPEDKKTPQQRWNETNKEKIREYSRVYRQKKTAEWRANHKEDIRLGSRHYGLIRRGLTVETYANILAKQAGVCAICEGVNADGRPLAVDHDHSCIHPPNESCLKCFRGLLCVHCNTTLHKMETMQGWHLKALAYLDRFREKNECSPDMN